MASKTYRDTPKLVGGYLSYPIETELGRFWQTIKADSPEWFTWLNAPNTKRFSYEGEFTILREQKSKGVRSSGWYWYAHKKIDGVTKKRYLGATSKVTRAALHEAADYFRELESYLPWYRRTMR